ncbi:integrase arm-type DNA-binding domain-containing protein [Vibrio parahaemolyticus]|uniref:integrase arm-type DNA-binding domain-containing protein n=1 Tax=Vibrio parahaemolyticus TaxID=670 RepID=UPI003891FAC8|nr:tyrosine-type recombinase/integrase [Vibrio parahaemolyticus]
MPKTVVKLTELKIKSAKAKEKEYSLADGDGLHLRISSKGTKIWIFNYTHPISKKRKNISLGKYPIVTLQKARICAHKARSLLAEGIDPKSHRDNELIKKQIERSNSFQTVSSKWLEVKKSSITENSAKDIWRSLELHVFPSIGTLPISELTAPLVIEHLRPLEKIGKLETLRRLCGRINEVMTFGVNCGYCQSNPLANIKSAYKPPKSTPMRSVAPSELHYVMRKMSKANMHLLTRCAFEFQLHTLLRPVEVARAEWSEIDFESRIWTIDAEKMKKRRPHRVPLSEPSIRILTQVREITLSNSTYVFPHFTDREKHMSSQTVNSAIKNAGLKGILVSHGLRSIGSTFLNDPNDLNVSRFEPDIIEVVLSHISETNVRSIYNRADYVERRREIMEYWSQFIIDSSKDCFTIAGTENE